MKRASYREAVEWIALNDSLGDAAVDTRDTIAGFISVCIIADIFDVSRGRVADDVMRYREKHA
jgi:hypothetical protein